MAAQSPTAAVTVVIPHYGDPAPTLALVDRLLTDPGDALAAVVVSDDASPTPYPEAHDPRLTVVRRERNGGFGANVNTGLAAVTTELALVLNSDAEITGAQIDALVAAAAPYQSAVRVPHGLHGSSDPLRRRGWLVDSRYRYARKFGHPRVLKAALTAATGANFAVNVLRQARGVDVDARAVLRDEHALVWKGNHR
ncbi:glycosyltransferase family 2 protein [Micrococcus luteus]|uniref:glycosyltransferase family 2 protein n=1 Tax=Micrococcus luteus TaxID=1270 RepID=UPI0011A72A98|nr:glycosyltransferase [Micrococcus luteus]